MAKPVPRACALAVLTLLGVVRATVSAQMWSATASALAVASQSLCEVTVPNGSTAPGERPSPSHHGNEHLWTQLWPGGTVVFRPGGPGFVLSDGSLQMKFEWWRGLEGPLLIEGRRLDAPAPPLRAHIPTGYGASGFQASGLIFPTAGCWEVTGRAGEATLSFVVSVVKIGEGPVQNDLP